MSNIIEREVAMGGELGVVLLRIYGKEKADSILKTYQQNKQNSLAYLEKIYDKIKDSRINNKKTQDELFVKILNDLINSDDSIPFAEIEVEIGAVKV